VSRDSPGAPATYQRLSHVSTGFAAPRTGKACGRAALRAARAEGCDVVVGIRHCPGVDVYYPHGGVFRYAWRQKIATYHPFALRWAKGLFGFFTAKNQVLRWVERRICAPGGAARIIAPSRLVRDTLVSYLPLSHIAEQMLSIHLPMAIGAGIYFERVLDNLGEALREARPAVFLGVPRVWEKIQAKIMAAGAS